MIKDKSMISDAPRTCVAPDGSFLAILHSPSFIVKNLRKTDFIASIGRLDESGLDVDNSINFPSGDVAVRDAEGVYEVPNPFPFWGATYILKFQAERLAGAPRFRFRPDGRGDAENSLLRVLLKGECRDDAGRSYGLADLPRPLLLAVVQTSRDPELLEAVAKLSCCFEFDSAGNPIGLQYARRASGETSPILKDHDLFEVVVNNPALPDRYKQAMVLVPGVQGLNPVVGEYGPTGDTHVWEYMRANSYIPWGHYASNMAHDSIRYRVGDLRYEDLKGLRALYYQRIYVQLAASLDVPVPSGAAGLGATFFPVGQLEDMRSLLLEAVRRRMDSGADIPFNATLWGWNYGFDFSPSGYRLHASHQQIHQQFALLSKEMTTVDGRCLFPTYAIGDQVASFSASYRDYYKVPFFDAYLKAIRSNKRLDKNNDLPRDLIVYEDGNVMAHVPKAQRSQGEIQIMTKAYVGNIIETEAKVRESLDMAIYQVMKAFDRLGTEMVTCYEVSKRFDNPDNDQRLFYCFLPRHPQSPGAFSERQGRWVTGHFPEDFARAFREAMPIFC